MHVSSRWCVTAVLAFGALACSDPVPAPAKGAFIAAVRAPSSPPPDTACKVGAAFTYDVPTIVDTKPVESLDADTYLHKVIDGENNATVSCSVKGGSTFTFSGDIGSGARAFRIEGSLGADKKGTAQVTVINQQRLSTPLASPGSTCVIDAVKSGSNNFQVKAGSMWASFDCAQVNAPPTDSCSAKGFFVLENCDQ